MASKVYIFFVAFKICSQKDESLRKDWIDSCEKAKKRSRTFCIHGIDFVHCVNRFHLISFRSDIFDTKHCGNGTKRENYNLWQISRTASLFVARRKYKCKHSIRWRFQLFRLLFTAILLEIFSLKLFSSMIRITNAEQTIPLLYYMKPFLFYLEIWA